MVEQGPVESEVGVGHHVLDGVRYVVLRFSTRQGEQTFYLSEDRAATIANAVLRVAGGVAVIASPWGGPVREFG